MSHATRRGLFGFLAGAAAFPLALARTQRDGVWRWSHTVIPADQIATREDIEFGLEYARTHPIEEYSVSYTDWRDTFGASSGEIAHG